MNINRDNYEEYFLLYADNELTDSEKAEVLLFVKHNKDLEEEFRMVHHTILKPDINVELTDKSFLFRTTEKSFINETNYKEVFVLYHDNELTKNEKKDTETFLSFHKELKDEFDLIGLARLTPESSVVFPGKKILYKGEKRGKPVPAIFWRMLAAAVFIGFGLWITSVFFQKPIQPNILSVHADPSKRSLPKNDKNILPRKKTAEVVAQLSTPADKNPVKEKVGKKVRKQSQSGHTTNDVAIKSSGTKQKPPEEDITNQLPKKIRDGIASSNDKTKGISKDESGLLCKIDPSKELAINDIVKNNVADEPVTSAKTVSYVADADNNNQNYVFYDVTTDKFKKTKLGGFLKKVKRVVERNNPIARLLSGDDRQVVAKQ